jgi:predicted DCC family thiol-disulfide oxidoreductase YuxK
MKMKGIILFDGECNFCDHSVQFIIKHDKKGYYQFASLQSEIGKRLLQEHHIPENIDSLILIENKKGYWESSAVLRISKHLSGFWKVGYVFLLVPRPFRNPFYRFIARNRYKWFGKKEECMLPSPEIRNRFLKDE